MRETPQAAAAFEEYCVLGSDRSLRKLAAKRDENGTKTGQIFKQLGIWSSEHNWQERVRQYDKERIEEKRRKQEAELEQMNEEHALLGQTQALRAVTQITALIEAKKFGSQAAVQLLKLATDLERVARGAVTSRMSITDADRKENVDDLTDDDLRLIAEMAEKMRARKEAS
jgi:hypothetical protein